MTQFCRKVFTYYTGDSPYTHMVLCSQHDGRPSPVVDGVCTICCEAQ